MQSPVTIRTGCENRIHVEAVTVVPTGHLELIELIIEFNIDARGLRMSEGICQSLSRNGKDLVHNKIGRAHV